MILDFTAYMKACYEHLLSTQANESTDRESHPYMYRKKDHELALERA